MIDALVENDRVQGGSRPIHCLTKVGKAWWDADRDMYIVLLDYNAGPGIKQFRNLLAYNVDNTVRWEAELPQTSYVDRYTDAEIIHGELSAYAFSGFSCTIDLDTGRIVERLFVK